MTSFSERACDIVRGWEQDTNAREGTVIRSTSNGIALFPGLLAHLPEGVGSTPLSRLIVGGCDKVLNRSALGPEREFERIGMRRSTSFNRMVPAFLQSTVGLPTAAEGEQLFQRGDFGVEFDAFSTKRGLLGWVVVAMVCA